MTKTKQNLKLSEEFISSILQKNFNQKVAPDKLRAAAEKLCAAIPQQRRRAAASDVTA